MVHPLLENMTSSADTDNFRYERSLSRQGFTAIGGSDEVGRGPLAGPVVAATVILPPACNYSRFIDSKQLNHSRRVALYEYLHEIEASIGIGIVSPRLIDEMNILQASLLAMKLSAEDLSARSFAPDYILVDGKFTIPMATPQLALIKGESKSASIAAASIVAKVTRDRIMDQLHATYPDYRFDRHKGYPTKIHRQMLALHGPCEVHRRSFRGVSK